MSRLMLSLVTLSLVCSLVALLAATQGACYAHYAAFGSGNAWCILR